MSSSTNRKNAIGSILNACSFTNENSDEKGFQGEWKLMVNVGWVFDRVLKGHLFGNRTKFKAFLQSQPKTYIVSGNWFQSWETWRDLPTEDVAFEHLVQSIEALPQYDWSAHFATLFKKVSKGTFKVRFRTEATLKWCLLENEDVLKEYFGDDYSASSSTSKKSLTTEEQRSLNKIKTLTAAKPPRKLKDIRDSLKADGITMGLIPLGMMISMKSDDFYVEGSSVFKINCNHVQENGAQSDQSPRDSVQNVANLAMSAQKPVSTSMRVVSLSRLEPNEEHDRLELLPRDSKQMATDLLYPLDDEEYDACVEGMKSFNCIML